MLRRNTLEGTISIANGPWSVIELLTDMFRGWDEDYEVMWNTLRFETEDEHYVGFDLREQPVLNVSVDIVKEVA